MLALSSYRDMILNEVFSCLQKYSDHTNINKSWSKTACHYLEILWFGLGLSKKLMTLTWTAHLVCKILKVQKISRKLPLIKIRMRLQNDFDPIVKTYHRKKLAQILWCINNNMNNEIAVVVDDNVIWFEDEMRPPRKLGWDAIFSGE